MDERLRGLERRALTGDLDAAAARRRERVVARRTILETPLTPPPTSAVSAWALDLRAV